MESSRHLFKITPYSEYQLLAKKWGIKSYNHAICSVHEHLFVIYRLLEGQRFITETTTAVSIQLAIYNWREGKGLYYLERLSSYIQLDPKWYHRVTT
ncbi:hypothetical protein RhiirB3_419763 [Rhizophagus irregularis]|nr:hypothetical protein RhiirB3_419763 [Rhizophagus irregularis]